MGFEVRDKDCYDGIPSSIRKGPAPKEPVPDPPISLYQILITILICLVPIIIFYEHFSYKGFNNEDFQPKKKIDIRQIRIDKLSKKVPK
jgi:hypothetical protein